MTPRSLIRLVGLSITLLVTARCGGDSTAPPPPPPRAERITVDFAYLARTRVDPAVREQFPSCMEGVGNTHIHPSWRNFSRFDMSVVDERRWGISFHDVTVGRQYRIRISDPNACATDRSGASTRNVFANGVPLTRVVDTPGNGPEPGLAFTVTEDGQIVP